MNPIYYGFDLVEQIKKTCTKIALYQRLHKKRINKMYEQIITNCVYGCTLLFKGLRVYFVF